MRIERERERKKSERNDFLGILLFLMMILSYITIKRIIIKNYFL